MSAVGWRPIATAPQDGRPVWVRGWDWGREGGVRHHTWAFSGGDGWTEATMQRSELSYLTDWMPLPPTTPDAER